MYTDKTLQPIYDYQQYISTNGTIYPSHYPKNEIPGVFPVTPTPRPSDPYLVVTGFTINDQRIQVWQTREKTEEEHFGELKSEALSALTKSDSVAIRCVKAGIPFPADWQEYVAGLRAVVNGSALTLPEQPEYPEGT